MITLLAVRTPFNSGCLCLHIYFKGIEWEIHTNQKLTGACLYVTLPPACGTLCLNVLDTYMTFPTSINLLNHIFQIGIL